MLPLEWRDVNLVSHKLRGLPYRIVSERDGCKNGTIRALTSNGLKIANLNWGATDEDRYLATDPVSGMPSLEPESRGEYFSLMYINDVEVKESFRHKGIGTEMYRELCKLARRCKFSDVEGGILNRYALRARNSVFGKPLSILAKRGDDEEWITLEEAEKILPEYRGRIEELTVVVRHDVDTCRFVSIHNPGTELKPTSCISSCSIKVPKRRNDRLEINHRPS